MACRLRLYQQISKHGSSCFAEHLRSGGHGGGVAQGGRMRSICHRMVLSEALLLLLRPSGKVRRCIRTFKDTAAANRHALTFCTFCKDHSICFNL